MVVCCHLTNSILEPVLFADLIFTNLVFQLYFFYTFGIMLYISAFILLIQPEFYTASHTKSDYDEIGPSICRHNPVFGAMA